MSPNLDFSALAETCRRVLAQEADALNAAAARVGAAWQHALRLMLESPGRVHLVGLGKSGLVAQKIVATLNSTGTPANFLHAAEAFHGDLGAVRPGEVCLLFSKSGTTAEVVKLMPLLRQMGCPLVAVAGNPDSPLARGADVFLDASVTAEADGLNLAPTTSTTLAMGIGDALAAALMQARNFRPEDFARFHPGGQLGSNLSLTVRDRLQPLDRVAVCAPEDPLRQVIIRMTERPLGAALVLGPEGQLAGIITDGDVRRALLHTDDIRTTLARDILTARPTVIGPDILLHQALALMEHPRPLSVLPVIGPLGGVVLGVLRIHDIYSA